MAEWNRIFSSNSNSLCVTHEQRFFRKTVFAVREREREWWRTLRHPFKYFKFEFSRKKNLTYYKIEEYMYNTVLWFIDTNHVHSYTQWKILPRILFKRKCVCHLSSSHKLHALAIHYCMYGIEWNMDVYFVRKPFKFKFLNTFKIRMPTYSNSIQNIIMKFWNWKYSQTRRGGMEMERTYILWKISNL